jgi:hypothetical protein
MVTEDGLLGVNQVLRFDGDAAVRKGRHLDDVIRATIAKINSPAHGGYFVWPMLPDMTPKNLAQRLMASCSNIIYNLINCCLHPVSARFG